MHASLLTHAHDHTHSQPPRHDITPTHQTHQHAQHQSPCSPPLPTPHHPTLPLQGSSVPIAIPNLSRWKSPSDAPAPAGPGAKAAAAPGADPRGAAPHAAGGFVPPHKLTRQEDFTFSFNGASPSGCLKRERLRARNAILRSTGFLEPKEGGGGAGGGGGVAHSLPVAHGGGMMLRFEQHRQQQQQAQQLKGVHPPSSLTAALSTIGEGL